LRLEDVCAVVASRNDAATIGECLESVRGFGGIVVVDAFSNDGTAEVARGAGAVLYSRHAVNAAEQKNWAVTRAPCRWVLSLDASEIVSDALRERIAGADGAAAGFVVRVQNEYLGRVMKSQAASFGGGVRLFASGSGRFVPDRRDPSGARVEVEGPTESLEGVVLRRSIRDIHLHLEAINRETTVAARKYIDGGGRLAVVRVLFQPALRFWKLYLLWGGIRDGARGLMYCLLSAYGSFVTYAKAWELHGGKRREKKKRGKDAA
jgi:glycosyltransferase involved in cell wall biosynthesis